MEEKKIKQTYPKKFNIWYAEEKKEQETTDKKI